MFYVSVNDAVVARFSWDVETKTLISRGAVEQDELDSFDGWRPLAIVPPAQGKSRAHLIISFV